MILAADRCSGADRIISALPIWHDKARISDYENDVIRIPADVIVEIAKTLAASTDELA